MATLKQIYAPIPLPVRAQAIHIGSDPKGENILYCVGNSVVIRGMKDISKADLYQQHVQQPTVARYSPSRFYIASADASGKVRIWDTTQAEHILKNEYHLLSGPILDMAWTDDSKRLAVAGQGKEKFGTVVSFDTGASVGEVTGHTKTINSIDLRQSRPYRLVTGSEDFSINFFEGPPFKFKCSKRDHQRFVNCVRFSPNGQKIVSASSDKMALIFDGNNGDKIAQLLDSAHNSGIYSVAWSPDSNIIVTASSDKTIKLWDASTYTEIKCFVIGKDIEDQQLGCIWNGDNIVSVSLSGYLTVIDPENGPIRVIRGHNKLITALTYDPNSKKIYSGDFGAAMLVWDADSAETNVFSGSKHLNQISGLDIARGFLYSISMDDSLKISPLDSLTWGESISLDIQPSGLAASSTHDLAIVVGGSSIIVIMGNRIALRTPLEYVPMCVTLSPSGDEIAVGGKDFKVYIYSLSISGSSASISLKYRLTEPRGEVLSLAYSFKGLLASGDGNREVIVWNGQDRIVSGWVFHTTRINCIAWSPDNQHIASVGTDSNLIIWNIDEPSKRITFKNAHYGGAGRVVWRSSNELITGGQDCALKAWTISY